MGELVALLAQHRRDLAAVLDRAEHDDVDRDWYALCAQVLAAQTANLLALLVRMLSGPDLDPAQRVEAAPTAVEMVAVPAPLDRLQPRFAAAP
jgi:hypothetical protein